MIGWWRHVLDSWCMSQTHWYIFYALVSQHLSIRQFKTALLLPCCYIHFPLQPLVVTQFAHTQVDRQAHRPSSIESNQHELSRKTINWLSKNNWLQEKAILTTTMLISSSTITANACNSTIKLSSLIIINWWPCQDTQHPSHQFDAATIV